MFDIKNLKWTREPANYVTDGEKIEITTSPHTDLWQKTYYHFINDNAPALQTETEEKFFSFTVKTEFESKNRFDQCGIDRHAGVGPKPPHGDAFGLFSSLSA